MTPPYIFINFIPITYLFSKNRNKFQDRTCAGCSILKINAANFLLLYNFSVDLINVHVHCQLDF